MTKGKTIRLPIKANYTLVDGKPVMVSAEYADVDVSIIAKLLVEAYRRRNA